MATTAAQRREAVKGMTNGTAKFADGAEVQVAQTAQTPMQRRAAEGMAPSRVSLSQLREMFERSVPVRLAWEFVSGNVARRLGEYSNPDPRIEEEIRRTVFKACLKAAPSLGVAGYLGVALAEPRYMAENGATRLHRVKIADPDVFWSGSPERDEATDEVVRWTRGGQGAPIELFTEAGVRQVVHYPLGSPWGNAWGDGWGKRAWASYLTLKNLIIYEGIAAEVASVPHKTLPYQPADMDATKLQSYVDAVANLGTNGVAALPAEHFPQGLQVVPSALAQGAYDLPIRRHVTWAFWAAGVPPLLLAEAQYGTRAQSSTQMDAYLGTETQLAETLADDCLRDQIIAPYVWLRYGPNADPGEISIRPAQPPDPAQWATIIAGLTAGGWMDPADPVQRQQVGEIFEFELGSDLPPLPGDRAVEQRAMGDLQVADGVAV